MAKCFYRTDSHRMSQVKKRASRSLEKDFCRFLEIALSSAFELEARLIRVSSETKIV